jgi:hypothetical protein
MTDHNHNLRPLLQTFVRRMIHTGRIQARLGLPEEDGTFTFDVPDRPNRVYVQILEGDSTSIAEAINSNVARLPNLPVTLDHNESGELYIVSTNDTDLQAFAGDVPIPNMSVGPHTHALGFGLDDPVDARRTLAGLVFVGSGMIVQIKQFLYEYRGAVYFSYNGSADLTSFIPVDDSTTLAVVYYDPVNQVYGAASTTLLINPTTPTEANIPNVTLPDDAIPLAGVKLTAGMTTVNAEHLFVDARLPLDRAVNSIQADLLLRDATTLIAMASGAATATRSHHIIGAEAGHNRRSGDPHPGGRRILPHSGRRGRHHYGQAWRGQHRVKRRG